MRFNYTYKITYGSGQCYDRWKHQLGIEITPEQYSKIIETVIQGRSISENTELEDVIQEMEENVRFVDRFQNLDGSSRNTPLKKERDITKIELLVPKDELRRIRKMKNPLEALTRSEEQMTIYRNSDGSSVILNTQQGKVRIKDSRKGGTEVLMDADQFLDLIVRW